MKANNSVTVLEALKDPHLFGGLPAFRDLTTWSAWIVFLKATYGLALTRHERKLFEQHTGRATYARPAGGFPEAVAHRRRAIRQEQGGDGARCPRGPHGRGRDARDPDRPGSPGLDAGAAPVCQGTF